MLLVAGIAVPLTSVLATIWLNEQTTGEIRATLHSLLAQAEYLGVVVGGVGVAALADVGGTAAALAGCAALFGAAAGSCGRSPAVE